MKYESQDQFNDKYDEAPMVFVSKGENRPFVEKALAKLGITLPRFLGRCLHLPVRQ